MGIRNISLLLALFVRVSLLLSILQSSSITITNAFSSTLQQHATTTSSLLRLASTTTDETRNNVISVANRIRSKDGVFVSNSDSKSELENAVMALENSSSEEITYDDCKKYFCGDWILLCTASTDTTNNKINTDDIMDKLPGPLKDIRQSINDNIRIIQKIKTSSDENIVDRIDNIIEVNPPKSLESVFDNVPDFLKGPFFTGNPLEVTKSQTILIHTAEMTSIVPKAKTQLQLQSIVFNVAGKSQFLEPDGADLVGLNIPTSIIGSTSSTEFFFETTYLDETLRISRGKADGNGPNQLRVFIRDPDSQFVVPTTTTTIDDNVETTVAAATATETTIENDESTQEKGDVAKKEETFEDVEWVEEEDNSSTTDNIYDDDGTPSD